MMRAVRLLGLVLAALPALAEAEVLRVRVDLLHVGDGQLRRDVVVRIEEGRFAAVEADDGQPVDLRAAVATPGFIDAHTSAGLSGLTNVEAVRDQDERSGPDQSGLRALDAFDPHDPLLRYLLEHGVTIVQTGPGPANPIAGQAAIFRTHGGSADAMLLRAPSALVFNLGESAKGTYGDEGGFPGTRMGVAALIRDRLRGAGERRRFFEREGAQALGHSVMRDVARGRLPALFRARRADDIETALRIADEFDLELQLAGATEGYLVRDRLAAAEVPVFVGPVMERVSSPESINASYENAALLAEAGVSVAIRSGFEAYVPKNRVLLFEAAIAVANGLPPARAVESISLAPARMLGLEADYGSVEVGKVADLVLFDGDPFEYRTRIRRVVVAGRPLERP